MKASVLFAGVLALSALPVFAADDPIAVRKALMGGMGGAAGLTAGVMKGELDYSPAIGKAAISTAAAVAAAYPDFFPEGSGEGDTTAAPAIWEDPEGFAEEISKLQEATTAALEVSGRNGPADAESFTEAMKPVLGTCKGCHENYRIEK